MEELEQLRKNRDVFRQSFTRIILLQPNRVEPPPPFATRLPKVPYNLETSVLILSLATNSLPSPLTRQMPAHVSDTGYMAHSGPTYLRLGLMTLAGLKSSSPPSCSPSGTGFIFSLALALGSSSPDALTARRDGVHQQGRRRVHCHRRSCRVNRFVDIIRESPSRPTPSV